MRIARSIHSIYDIFIANAWWFSVFFFFFAHLHFLCAHNSELNNVYLRAVSPDKDVTQALKTNTHYAVSLS